MHLIITVITADYHISFFFLEVPFMPEAYDAIVIGAGHNGLTCACYLARAS
jgi:ribulose 1,5-bisphosphate synthetase/thiazole synthase